MRQFLTNISKYFVEGLVVAVVAYYIPKKQTDLKSIVMIGVVAALTFAVLDFFAPAIGSSSRLGAGFGIGSNMVGFGSAGLNAGFGEGFSNTANIVNQPANVVTATDAAGNKVLVQVPNNSVVANGNGVVNGVVPVVNASTANNASLGSNSVLVPSNQMNSMPSEIANGGYYVDEDDY